MLPYLTLIFACQLVGETLTGVFALPVPGPVVGMVLLLCYLMVRGSAPEDLERTADGLLSAMSLLFVPAGAGVILHFRLLGEGLLPLGGALIASTLLAIAVTALLMRWLTRGGRDA
ncbi:CidA/LrgA family protein [Roseovarius salinarum]|uniref:CidA/LrgA family protein n=1 Tax=Roseovarius salinarum TaxID=1981892 RepID=UPI000C3349A9|nr:CidA/LrgA family protein [Roseovarius salinarum]